MKFIRTSNGLIEVRFYGLVGYVRDPFNNEFAPIGLILFIFFLLLFMTSLLDSFACESFDQATGNELPYKRSIPAETQPQSLCRRNSNYFKYFED